MKKLPLVLLSLGMALIAGGFVYDVMFAGIPYQDPTPQMQAGYDFHASVSAKIVQIGTLLVIASAVSFLWRLASPKKKPIQPAQPTPGS